MKSIAQYELELVELSKVAPAVVSDENRELYLAMHRAGAVRIDFDSNPMTVSLTDAAVMLVREATARFSDAEKFWCACGTTVDLKRAARHNVPRGGSLCGERCNHVKGKPTAEQLAASAARRDAWLANELAQSEAELARAQEQLAAAQRLVAAAKARALAAREMIARAADGTPRE